MEQKKELFREQVKAGDRMYFFNVRESVKGSKYLTINESRKVGDKFENKGILIFENQIPAFTDGFKKVYEFIKPKETAAQS
jgi:hypothetical protein